MNSQQRLDYYRRELDKADSTIEQLWHFLGEHLDNDIAIGALRIIKGPPTLCDYGHTNDHALGIYCQCWQPITPDNKPEWLDIEEPPENN